MNPTICILGFFAVFWARRIDLDQARHDDRILATEHIVQGGIRNGKKSDAMSAFAKIGHDNDAGKCPLLG
ncbi:MAG: hypothetical protein ACXWDN_21560 [Limisphaerales bacterium]